MNIHTRRFVEFLETEHLDHAGTENGNLAAPYDQLEAWGIGRRYIHGAIEEAEFLGLIVVTRRGGTFDGRKVCSRYRLAWLGDCYGNPPPNRWKAVTKEQIEAWREGRKCRRRQEKNSLVGCTTCPP